MMIDYLIDYDYNMLAWLIYNWLILKIIMWGHIGWVINYLPASAHDGYLFYESVSNR